MDLEKRIDEHDRQFARHEKMMDRIDKRLDATAKLVQAGMKLVIAERKQQKENWKQQKEANGSFQYKLNALIHSQQQTGEQIKQLTGKMDRFIDELRRGNRNGHSS